MADSGLRFMLRDLAHRPFQDEISQRFLWVLGLGPDACIEKVNQGVHGRFVGYANATFLPYLARDRGDIQKGLTESDGSWRERIKAAPDAWRVAGNAWSILQQCLGYVLASTPAARTVSTLYTSGTATSTQWDYYDAGDVTTAPPKHVYTTSPKWDWDSTSPTTGSWGWWRNYVVIEAVAPNEWIGTQPGPWGTTGEKWGQAIGAWGVSRPKEVGRSLQRIIQQWKAAGAWAHWVILSFDAAQFIPSNPTVDGNYGRWSRVSGRLHVRARSTNARYFRGQYQEG